MTNQEINEAVGDKLFPGNNFRGAGGYGYAGPPYTTDIAVAWEIVDRMKDKYFCIDRGVGGEWTCSITWEEYEQTDFVVIGIAQTAPIAICKAFLELGD